MVVTAEARPTRYIWTFGDGRSKVTNHSGRRWTKQRPGNIAHKYQRSRRYRVAVTVVWQARWRINRGAWRPLGAFTTGDERAYRVRQMLPFLVRSDP